MTTLVPPLLCNGVCIHIVDLSKDHMEQCTNEFVKVFVGLREVCKIDLHHSQHVSTGLHTQDVSL